MKIDARVAFNVDAANDGALVVDGLDCPCGVRHERVRLIFGRNLSVHRLPCGRRLILEVALQATGAIASDCDWLETGPTRQDA